MADLYTAPNGVFRDRRTHRRIGAAVPGRFEFVDGSQHDCMTVDISATSVALRTPTAAPMGEHVTVELDELGRLEGVVTRTTANGVVLKLNLDGRQTERLSRWIEKMRAHDLATAS